MNAAQAMNEFRHFVGKVLMRDSRLTNLSEQAEVVEGAFEQLLCELSDHLQKWWAAHPVAHSTIGHYYEDSAFVRGYELRQRASIPGRGQLLTTAVGALGDLLWKPALDVCSGSGTGARQLLSAGAITVASDAFPILSANANELEGCGVKVQRELQLGDLRKDAWHDPEIPGRPLPTSAQTVRDIVAGQQQRGRSMTMLEVTATLLMRRTILHDEHRLTLNDELSAIRTAFGNARVRRHETYREWAVFTAEKT